MMLHTKRHKSVIKANSKRFEYAREHGVCVRCGAKFEPNGHTVCPRCRKALNELLAIMRGRR